MVIIICVFKNLPENEILYLKDLFSEFLKKKKKTLKKTNGEGKTEKKPCKTTVIKLKLGFNYLLTKIVVTTSLNLKLEKETPY